MKEKLATVRTRAKKMGRPAGRTHPSKRTGGVRVGFPIRGPIQTDRFGPLQTLKWVDPLEMPLALELYPHRPGLVEERL
jgi:hypothetical protein